MEAWLHSLIHTLLGLLALPTVGLPAIFLVSLVSATLLPLGSEPAVFAYAQSVPHMFWPAVLVATAGNTAGGAIGYAMGIGAQTAWHRWQDQHATHDTEPSPPARHGRWHALSTRWFQRFGPPALLLSWLPVIGDPLCVAAGWLRLPFWPCVAFMAIGKCLRYIVMTTVLLHAWPWLNAWL